jgi:SAM-dependent methyltransferase
MSDYKNVYYPESRFGGFTDIDGTIIFYCRVNALIKPLSVVLDIGCGRRSLEDPIIFRRELSKFRGKCEKVIGIDVDEGAKINPFIDEFRLIKNNCWPIGDESIDVAVTDWVIEHVEDPSFFFSECHRTIKPGGYLCIRTMNLLSYVGIGSKLIPNKYHYVLKETMQSRVLENEGIFPVYYKCNTIRKMRRFFDEYGFDNYVYGFEAEPSYMSFSKFFYWLGVLHQKFAPRIFKITILGFGRKTKKGHYDSK